MTSRMRILTVLRGGIPDRVPVTLFIHDEGHFLKQIHPDLDITDYSGNKRKVIDLQRKLGADIHLRMWGGCFPLWLVAGGVNTIETDDRWDVRTKTESSGSDRVFSTDIITPEGTLSQAFTISEVNPGTFHYACTEKPVKSISDLELIARYEPPMDENFPERLRNLVSGVKEYLGEDGVISLWLPGGIFNHASRLMESETLYILYLTEPDFYRKLLETAFIRTKTYIQAALDTEVDILNIGGNVAGGFIGKTNFDRYVLPHEKKLIDTVKQGGKMTLYHNCGNIMNLTESYLSLGADIVESFSSPPLGDGDLTEAKKLVGGGYSIIGNVDQVNVIQNGNAGDIEDAVQKALKAGKPGGRYILQPSDFLEYGTPVENVEAYIKAGIAHGGY
jgi:uroporphyrinogen decarboxylase